MLSGLLASEEGLGSMELVSLFICYPLRSTCVGNCPETWRFKVLTAVTMKVTIFLDVMPCSVAGRKKLHCTALQKIVIFILKLGGGSHVW
jgi:hypothetical protein